METGFPVRQFLPAESWHVCVGSLGYLPLSSTMRSSSVLTSVYNGLHCLTGTQVASEHAGQHLSYVLVRLHDSTETGDCEGVAT